MTEEGAGWNLDQWTAGLRMALQRVGQLAVKHADALRAEAEAANAQARADASGLRVDMRRLDAQVRPDAVLPARIAQVAVEWRKEEALVLPRLSERRRALANLQRTAEVACNRVQAAHAILMARSALMPPLRQGVAATERILHERIVSLEQAVAAIRQMDQDIREAGGASP